MTRHPDMTTFTGQHIFYDDLDNLPLVLEDVKVASSNIRRYIGHLDWVLIRHLCLCARLASHHLWETKKIFSHLTPGYSAIHDFHEIYMADMPAGLKKYIPEYCKLENQAERSVHRQLHLPIENRPSDEVKFIDLRALVCEMYLLDHKSKEACAVLYGGIPSKDEMAIIRTVQAAPTDACWNTICYYIGTTYSSLQQPLNTSADGTYTLDESKLG